jgi:hypothetical protein
LIQLVIDHNRPEAYKLRHFLPRGQHHKARIMTRKQLHQLREALVLELAPIDVRRVLQRLQPVEEKQHALLLDELRQRAPALDRVLRQIALPAEIAERLGDEAVGVGALLLARALAVGRPTIDAARPAAALSKQFICEGAEQRRFPRSAERMEDDRVDLLRRLLAQASRSMASSASRPMSLSGAPGMSPNSGEATSELPSTGRTGSGFRLALPVTRSTVPIIFSICGSRRMSSAHSSNG